MSAREKNFYVMAKVDGDIAVTIRATSKKAAIERLKNGDWDDVWNVEFRPVGNVHCEPAQ